MTQLGPSAINHSRGQVIIITMYKERRRETRQQYLVYSMPRLELSWTSEYKGSNRDTKQSIKKNLFY